MQVRFADARPQGSYDLALVARQNGELHVRIRDTGIGFVESDRSRLFQPFTQLDSGLTRRHGGT